MPIKNLHLSDPINQNQHKIPRVYLKQFGYKTPSNQFMVSVKSLDKPYTEQKSIKTFSAEINIFDVDSEVPDITRLFEKLNGLFESYYPKIILELETSGTLSEKSYAYLLQFIANLIVRSDYWRGWVADVLNSTGKEVFLLTIMRHLCKNEAEFKLLSQQDFYLSLATSPFDNSVLNRALLYFHSYLVRRIGNYEIVIIQSQKDKPWWTSTNPVVVLNKISGIELLTKESELYFPLSPKYLIYLHNKDSSDKANPLRALDTNEIYSATDSQNKEFQKLILANHIDFVIIAGRYEYGNKRYNRKSQG